ncbi:MAG: hypothetical protein AAFN77_07905 [Planctomycetota bacterium]
MFDTPIKLSSFASELVTDTAIDRYAKMCVGEYPAAALATPEQRNQLEQMSVELVLGDVSNQDLAKCCLSGIWLLFGELERSHDISQVIKTQEGSFWHGLMHRLEPDFWNSKYWYRNVGDHPVVASIQSLAGASYPFDFVDDCESVIEQRGVAEATTNQVEMIAREEWKRLFAFCWHHATHAK